MFSQNLAAKLAESNQSNAQQTFDVIIVGAGTCGSLVARELLEGTENLNVLLLESGSYHNVDYGQYFQNMQAYGGANDYNTTFYDYTFSEKKVSEYHRGKGFGGTTITNGAVWVDPTSDIKRWSQTYELSSWENNLQTKVGKLCELLTPNDSSPRKIDFMNNAKSTLSQFFQANTTPEHGAHYTSTINNQGSRRDVFASLLEDYYNDPRLTIMDHADVQTINFSDANQAESVTIRKDGLDQTFSATQKIILSAGAVGSPLILQRSGITSERAAAKMHEEPRAILPVGENLRVHHNVFVYGKLKQSLPQEHRTNMDLTVFTCGMADFSTQDHIEHEAKYKAQTFIGRDANGNPENLIVGVFPLADNSLGYVRIDESDPNYAIIKTSKSISDTDRDSLIEACRVGDKIMQTLANDELVEYESLFTDETIEAYIQENNYIEPHFLGTCAVNQVVDEYGAVNGTLGLYVCDASILPEQPHGNCLAAAMVASLACCEAMVDDLNNHHAASNAL